MKSEQLAPFLEKAKKKTFASRFSIPKQTPDGGKEYSYQENDFLYKDKYFGSIIDTGQELVFYKGDLIWFMSYHGGMLANQNNLSKKCFSFLKKCLRDSLKDFPVRGKSFKKKRDFTYKNCWKGDLKEFVGKEKIFFKGKNIYFRNYLGGYSLTLYFYGKLLTLTNDQNPTYLSWSIANRMI